MKVVVDERESAIAVEGLKHLDEIIADAVERAKREGVLGTILLKNDYDDELGLAVGSNETVLSFNYGHGDPPYYVSKGKLDTEEPILTCYFLFQHHTEFLRKWIIPFNAGVLACHEFYNSGNLPSCIEWVEV
jgi:hypothetical protein